MRFAVGIILCGLVLFAQSDVQPTNSLPTPYQTIKDWAKLTEGRMWGSTSAVEIDKDGNAGLPQGSGLGVEMDEEAIAKVAADPKRKYKWPSPKYSDGSIRDY